MTLKEVYAALPLSAKTLWKQLKDYPRVTGLPNGVEMRNDTDGVNEFRVIIDGRETGLIAYHRGRKLCCWELCTGDYQVLR